MLLINQSRIKIIFHVENIYVDLPIENSSDVERDGHLSSGLSIRSLYISSHSLKSSSHRWRHISVNLVEFYQTRIVNYTKHRIRKKTGA